MSVQANTYVMVGVILPFDAFSEDERDQFELYQDSAFRGIHHHNGLCVVSDGMNGKYLAAGRILEKSENHEGIKVTDCRVGDDLKREVSDLLDKHLKIRVSMSDISVWAFTHYR